MANTEPIVGTYQLAAQLQGQPGYSLIENPPFHPNILNIPFRQLGVTDLPAEDTVQGSANYDLYRGLMVTRYNPNGPASTSSSNQYRVNFLYNPSTISESRSIDLNNQVLPTYARNPDDPGQYNTALNSTISFSLLFDRTFELWDSAYVGTQAGTYGISVDTNAFYNMLGINQPAQQTSATVSTSTFGSDNRYSLIVQGTMGFVPVDLYFGYKAIGSLKYFGYITDLAITYTHFTQKMVPQRCAIDINFSILPEVSNSTG